MDRIYSTACIDSTCDRTFEHAFVMKSEVIDFYPTEAESSLRFGSQVLHENIQFSDHVPFSSSLIFLIFIDRAFSLPPLQGIPYSHDSCPCYVCFYPNDSCFDHCITSKRNRPLEFPLSPKYYSRYSCIQQSLTWLAFQSPVLYVCTCTHRVPMHVCLCVHACVCVPVCMCMRLCMSDMLRCMHPTLIACRGVLQLEIGSKKSLTWNQHNLTTS